MSYMRLFQSLSNKGDVGGPAPVSGGRTIPLTYTPLRSGVVPAFLDAIPRSRSDRSTSAFCVSLLILLFMGLAGCGRMAPQGHYVGYAVSGIKIEAVFNKVSYILEPTVYYHGPDHRQCCVGEIVPAQAPTYGPWIGQQSFAMVCTMLPHRGICGAKGYPVLRIRNRRRLAVDAIILRRTSRKL